jgi:hypothetical protein
VLPSGILAFHVDCAWRRWPSADPQRGHRTGKNGRLEVCGQKFPFGEIEQEKTKAIQYKVRSDSQYKLEVEFHSGKKLEKELGSATNGQDVEDVLTVNDRDVSLTR